MNNGISVIIPFFQRNEGLLSHAVQSIIHQEGVDNVTIIVVDDGSPVSAREELASLPPTPSMDIKIIEQENSGVAGARNKGLDNLPADTTFVAFLDSDDAWTTDHLANALRALQCGYDFYFSDFYHPEQRVSAFDRARKINVDEHPLLDGSEFLHGYAGDMTDQVIRGNIIGTPTVVYDYRSMPDLRFRDGTVHAGEDYLFWLDVARRTSRIAFSSRRECQCGKGVNIYAEAAWGTTKYLRVTADDVRYRKVILTDFDITPDQKRFLRRRIARLRKSFVRGVLNLLRTGDRREAISLLREYAEMDSAIYARFLPLMFAVICERLGKPYTGLSEGRQV